MGLAAWIAGVEELKRPRVCGQSKRARINTLGERAEDVFLVSGEALSAPKAVLQLEQELLNELQAKPRVAA